MGGIAAYGFTHNLRLNDLLGEPCHPPNSSNVGDMTRIWLAVERS
ncbi:MAG: hypothetical protein SWX82_10830 [Cyanobacteriota bacterium]|nr:hypothetical protein [Cyanobacteriota bacterium]